MSVLFSLEDGQGDETMFVCDNGRQIHMNLLCNYVQDCHDGSDEYCGKDIDTFELIK